MDFTRHTFAVLALLASVLLLSFVFVEAKQAAPTLFSSIDSVLVHPVPSIFASDRVIISAYHENLAKIPVEQQQELARYSDFDVLAVVRGTAKGKSLVETLTPEERVAVDNLVGEVARSVQSASQGDGSSASIWPRGGGSGVSSSGCPARTGGCTLTPSPQRICVDYVSVPTGRGQLSGAFACEYSCVAGPSGVGMWNGGTECPWPNCLRTQTCQ